MEGGAEAWGVSSLFDRRWKLVWGMGEASARTLGSLTVRHTSCVPENVQTRRAPQAIFELWGCSAYTEAGKSRGVYKTMDKSERNNLTILTFPCIASRKHIGADEFGYKYYISQASRF